MHHIARAGENGWRVVVSLPGGADGGQPGSAGYPNTNALYADMDAWIEDRSVGQFGKLSYSSPTPARSSNLWPQYWQKVASGAFFFPQLGQSFP